MTRKPGISIVAAILFQATTANAQLEDTPNLSFDGYGTVGVVHSNEGRADFVSNRFAPEGAGHTREWSPEVDSRLGLQLTANLTPRFSSIVQVVAEQRYDDTYKPAVEWANVKFDITPELSVRAGRMVLPSFLVSEYRKVGYATPWVRPPDEIYGLSPVTNIDGIGVSYRTHFAAFTNTLRASYGRQDAKLPGGVEAEARGAVTVVDTLEWGATSLFAQYSSGHVTIDAINPLFDAFRQFGPEGEAIADRYDADDKRVGIMSIGARHDRGDWFVMGEWARSNSRTFIGDTRGWYVTGGYRYGSVTPYVTLARVRVASNTSDPGLSLAGLPPPLAAQASGLNAALNELLGTAARQKSLSLGVRWDFTRNAALKAQYDYLDLDAGSPGVLVDQQPDFRPGGSVSLFSIALDFVF